MGENAYYPLKSDIVFKMVFGESKSKGILIDFLKATLDIPQEEYEDIEFMDPYSEKEYPLQKQDIFDIKLHTKTKGIIDIEIQLKNIANLRERMLLYATKMLNEQIDVGEPYGKIKRSILILITDFTIIEELKEYHSKFTMREDKHSVEFSNILEIDTLEISKLPAKSDNTKLYEWLKLIGANNPIETKRIQEEAHNKAIDQAAARLEALNMDKEARTIFENREKARRDELGRIEAGKEEGIAIGLEKGRAEGLEKGRAEGLEKGKVEIAKNSIKAGLSDEQISLITGLNLEQIKELKSS
jgi:predicted transposase/invertase (TIGR01784 family)